MLSIARLSFRPDSGERMVVRVSILMSARWSSSAATRIPLATQGAKSVKMKLGRRLQDFVTGSSYVSVPERPAAENGSLGG